MNLEDAMSDSPAFATREEAREAMALLQNEVERLQGELAKCQLSDDEKKALDLQGFDALGDSDKNELTGFAAKLKATAERRKVNATELQWFREREPLVTALLECFDLDCEYPQLAIDCGDGYRAGNAAKSVRDFKVSP